MPLPPLPLEPIRVHAAYVHPHAPPQSTPTYPLIPHRTPFPAPFNPSPPFQITFDYPFRIPPYFALIIRAIGVLEGIALVGNPDFAIVDEAFPVGCLAERGCVWQTGPAPGDEAVGLRRACASAGVPLQQHGRRALLVGVHS